MIFTFGVRGGIDYGFFSYLKKCNIKRTPCVLIYFGETTIQLRQVDLGREFTMNVTL